MAAAAWLAASSGAWALSLGRVTVQSALGEPLRAEVDVTSLSADEAATLSARIAGPEAYRAAGAEFNSALAGANVALVRRNGRQVLRVTSDRVMQEPFVDVILDLRWSSGQLVREYTLLFDPPTTRLAAPATPAPVAPAISPAPVAPAAPRSAAAPAPRPTAPPVAALPTPVETPRRAAAAPAPAPTSGDADSYLVRRGDTLGRIAAQTQRPGVSLDQMLVALYRANPQAFSGENMNRLLAGAVLAVPQTAEVQQLPPAEARQTIRAQSADFDAYRRRLAGAAPRVASDEPARSASGRVQAQVDDRRADAGVSPDQLRLSRGASAPGEAAVSQDTRRRDETQRVAELQRNLTELQALKSGAASASTDVPASTGAAPAASAPAVPGVAVTTAAPALAAAPAAAASAGDGAVSAAASAPVAAPATPVAAAPQPAPTPAPARASDDGMLSGLLDSPLTLPLGGLVLALLAGFGFYRMRNRKTESGETSFLESRLQPDSFFGASGGQRVDTRDATGMASSMSYSLSQLDAIGDVDPVAEADVYLAYGRDLQAEEILKEALRSNPDRIAIRTKLLDVYAKRRDTKGFELLATQVYAMTGGEGDDWPKVQAQGRQIDPDNTLYKTGGRPSAEVLAAAGGETLNASTMPQSVLPSASAYAALDVPQTLPNPDAAVDLDLDLDAPALGDFAPAAPHEKTQTLAGGELDFTLPGDGTPDFLLPPDTAVTAPAAPSAPGVPSGFDVGGLTLEFDPSRMSSSMPLADDPAAAAPASLPRGPVSIPGALAPDDGALLRKLELAEEFRQIGDVEGARDLLQEVVAQSEGSLRSKAQGLLDDLA